MNKHDVEHRQGSGYNTSEKISEFQLTRILRDFDKDNPWVFKCKSIFDYYEIGQRKEAILLLETKRASLSIV